jgi:glycosyltransferase involved in cell wall biosynthesis
MMRRLFVTADSVGGVWQYVCELSRALAEHEYEIIIALLGPPPSDAQRNLIKDIPAVTLLETGLPLDWMSRDAETVVESGRALARLSEMHRADVVQLNQPAFAAGVPFRMPVVAVAHSCVGTWWQAVHGAEPEPDDIAWQTGLMQRGLLAADATVTPSRAFAAAIQGRYGLPTTPHSVHNGRTPLAQSSGARHDFAFTAGRLWDDGKNVTTLDRAAARLGIPFKAAGSLVGPSGEHVHLEHLHHLGVLEENALAQNLASRPVFASAARYEPFGLAVVEAALAGCPLVLADMPTFRELWNGAATFVSPDDANGFADAIATIIGDDALRLQNGSLAQRRAENFMPARMGAAMHAIYTHQLVRAGRSVAA